MQGSVACRHGLVEHCIQCEHEQAAQRRGERSGAVSEKERCCRVTHNPCGTDTWPHGWVCACTPCLSWMRDRSLLAEVADWHDHVADQLEAASKTATAGGERDMAGELWARADERRLSSKCLRSGTWRH